MNNYRKTCKSTIYALYFKMYIDYRFNIETKRLTKFHYENIINSTPAILFFPMGIILAFFKHLFYGLLSIYDLKHSECKNNKVDEKII